MWGEKYAEINLCDWWNAAGKTYFIEHHLANEKAVVLDVYDYQQKVYDEHGNKERISL